MRALHARRYSDETMMRIAEMRKKGYSWEFIARFFNFEDARAARRAFRMWQRRKERNDG